MADEKQLKSNVPASGKETPPEFDAQLEQANRLPRSRWGGGSPSELVKPVTPEDEAQAAEFAEDEEFGHDPIDPSTFTGE